nr:cupredoxin family copper-binding protein [Steroidobacter cummioxidans]
MADRRMLAVVGSSLLAVATVADRALSAEPATHTVSIENMRFDPVKLSVRRGDRVVWVNKDLFPHTVTADGKTFDSGDIAAGQSWTYTATASGRYTYTCTYHPSMKGTLIVQ